MHVIFIRMLCKLLWKLAKLLLMLSFYLVWTGRCNVTTPDDESVRFFLFAKTLKFFFERRKFNKAIVPGFPIRK